MHARRRARADAGVAPVFRYVTRTALADADKRHRDERRARVEVRHPGRTHGVSRTARTCTE
jgi:hypothetical protein